MQLKRIFDKALGRTQLVEIHEPVSSNNSPANSTNSPRADAVQKKWRYKAHYFSGHGNASVGAQFENQISQLGDEGWEIASLCLVNPPPNERYLIIFKQQK